MDNQSIPSYVTQYFWGDDLNQLSMNQHQKYIVQTLLEMGNSDAIKWLFTTIDRETIKNFLPNLKLTKKSANFWNLYLN